MTDYSMEKTYSKNWCQGFCGQCGTGCGEHNEHSHQLQKEVDALRGMLAKADEEIKRYSDQSQSYLDTVRTLREEIEQLKAKI